MINVLKQKPKYPEEVVSLQEHPDWIEKILENNLDVTELMESLEKLPPVSAGQEMLREDENQQSMIEASAVKKDVLGEQLELDNTKMTQSLYDNGTLVASNDLHNLLSPYYEAEAYKQKHAWELNERSKQHAVLEETKLIDTYLELIEYGETVIGLGEKIPKHPIYQGLMLMTETALGTMKDFFEAKQAKQEMNWKDITQSVGINGLKAILAGEVSQQITKGTSQLLKSVGIQPDDFINYVIEYFIEEEVGDKTKDLLETIFKGTEETDPPKE